MKASYLYSFSALLCATMLAGCGGSSGSGSVAVAPTAEITNDNKTDLAVAASEAVKSATSTNTPSSIGDFGLKSTVSDIANKAFQMPNMRPVAGICLSGSVNVTGMDTYYTSNINLDMTFSSCVIDDGFGSTTYNGSASYIQNANGITISYNNFRITAGDEATSINGTISCDSSYLNCTDDLTFGGNITGTYSNQTYTTHNMEVSGDAINGYIVNGSVTHLTHGTISINASDLRFDCTTNGLLSAGTITVTASGGVTATITFNDCDSFTIEYDGSTTTVFWNTL